MPTAILHRSQAIHHGKGYAKEKGAMKTIPAPHTLLPDGSDHHYLDAMITGYLIFTAGIALLIATANQPGTTPYDVWIILTLAGSMVASSTAFLLGSLRETTSVKIGRAIASGVVGVVGSRVVYAWMQSLRDFIAEDKVMIFGLGFVLGLVGFLLAVPFIKTSQDRATAIAETIADRWQGRFVPPKTKAPDDIDHASTNHRRK